MEMIDINIYLSLVEKSRESALLKLRTRSWWKSKYLWEELQEIYRRVSHGEIDIKDPPLQEIKKMKDRKKIYRGMMFKYNGRGRKERCLTIDGIIKSYMEMKRVGSDGSEGEHRIVIYGPKRFVTQVISKYINQKWGRVEFKEENIEGDIKEIEKQSKVIEFIKEFFPLYQRYDPKNP